MSDEEEQEVRVVDRRASAGGDERPSREEATAGAPEDAAPTPDTVAPEDPGTEGGNAQPADDDEGLLNPAAVFAYAGAMLTTAEVCTCLLQVFDMQARYGLGLLTSPATGAVTDDPTAARASIDAIEFLLHRTPVDLHPDDRHEAERRLNDLRMTYVQKHGHAG